MAIVLNGSGQYVDLTDHGAAFDVRSRPLAFYAELKWTATGIMLAFSHGRANDGDQEYALFANISTAGRVIGRWENAVGDLFQPSYSGSLNDGEWHRVLVVLTSSPDNLAAIYVDGVLRTSFSVGSETGTQDHGNLTAIGYDLDTEGWDWDGEIANVAVWDADLTSEQAEDLTAGVITPADLTTGQIAHYPLDYDARDASGNGLDGTVVGGATFTEGPPARETETWDGVSDGTDINGDHTWTKVQESSGAGSWQIDTERLRLASETESYNTARAETDLGTADHYVEAELEFENGGSNEAGVCARFATSENTWYAAVMSPRNGAVSLIRCVDGVRTTIASRAETVAAGTYTVRITCDGDQITGSFEGFSDLSVTDTGITSGTRWGAYGRSRNLTWGHWWDNFTAQDLAFFTFFDRFAADTDTDLDQWPSSGAPDYAYNSGSGSDLTVSSANGRVELTATSVFVSARVVDPVGAAITGDQEVSANVGVAGSFSSGEVRVRHQPTGSSAYAGKIEISRTDGTRLRLYRVNGGSHTLLASGGPLGLTTGGHKLTLRAEGTNPVSLTLIVDDDEANAVTYDHSDSGRFETGVPGIGAWRDSGSHDIWIDDLEVYDLSSSSEESSSAGPATYRLFDGVDGPSNAEVDTQNYTLAVEFEVSEACDLIAYHVWIPSDHDVAADLPFRLWEVIDNNNGTAVTGSDVTLDSGDITPGQWNTVNLGTPVALSTGVSYRAGYHTGTNGGARHYAATNGYWTTGGPGESGITNGILTAPGSGDATGSNQGTFNPNSTQLQYPNEAFGSSNYWIDVTVGSTTEESSSSSEESSSAGPEEHSGSGLAASLVLTPGAGQGSPAIAGDGASTSVELSAGAGTGFPNPTGDGIGVELILVPGLGTGTSDQVEQHSGSGLPAIVELSPGVGLGAVAVAGEGAAASLELLPGLASGAIAIEAAGTGVVLVLRPGVGMGFAGSYTYRSDRDLVAVPDGRDLIAVPDERALVAVPFTRTLIPLED